MKIALSALCITTAILATPSYAAFNFGDSADAHSLLSNDSISALADGLAKGAKTDSNPELVESLSQSLDVTPAQATGGVGALLTYATQSLPSSQASELSSLVPGLDKIQNAMSGMNHSSMNMQGVDNTFGNLGMNTSMISKFSPLILKYLSGQGASSQLIESLSTLWQ